MPRTLLIAFLILSASSNPLFAQKKKGKRKQSNKQEVVSEMDRVSGERAFFEGIKYRAVDNYEDAIASFEASLSFFEAFLLRLF